jgi:hypothetical protein
VFVADGPGEVETIELSQAGQARERATWGDSSSRHCLHNVSFELVLNKRFQRTLGRNLLPGYC